MCALVKKGRLTSKFDANKLYHEIKLAKSNVQGEILQWNASSCSTVVAHSETHLQNLCDRFTDLQ